MLAPPAQRLALRIGHEQVTAAALVVLTLAEVLRLAGSVVALLYLSTFLTGAAIGAISTMMPGLLGYHLQSRPGLGAGIYSTAMAIGSTFAACWPSRSRRARRLDPVAGIVGTSHCCHDQCLLVPRLPTRL